MSTLNTLIIIIVIITVIIILILTTKRKGRLHTKKKDGGRGLKSFIDVYNETKVSCILYG